MKIEQGHITEATEEELWLYWSERYTEIMSFDDYLRKCQEKGVKIKE